MPKIWTVAGQMLHSPQTALYWGSYLMKVCTETKTLCMQFESIVTNSSLTFKDIAFLELAPRFAPLFKLTENGDIDWQTLFDDLGNIGHSFTKENLQEVSLQRRATKRCSSVVISAPARMPIA